MAKKVPVIYIAQYEGERTKMNNPFKERGKMISLKKLKPCQFDVLREIDRSSDSQYLSSLREDITERGVLVPLMVKEVPGDKYDVICGNTRFFIADFEFKRGNKDFKELCCDVLQEDMDIKMLEITAILDNINRRMVSTVGKHLMIARYKEQIETIVSPHRDKSGKFSDLPLPEDRLPSKTQAIIKGIRREGEINKYVAKNLGVSKTVVGSADETVKALRYKINADSGTTTPIRKSEPHRVERIIEELAKAPDNWSKKVFRAGPQKLIGEYKQSLSLTTPPAPYKVETVTDKNWPGDWKKTETEVYTRIQKADTTKYTPKFVVSIKWWRR